MPLQLIDRFHPHLCAQQQAVIDAGEIYKRDELQLLEPEQLRPLSLLSLLLLGVGTLFFLVLTVSAYWWRQPGFEIHLSWLSFLLWLVGNIVGYLIILPVHELIHGLVFLLWGGKPFFGAKLPLALYCGAKNQLFRRNHYLSVGLAPLVVITLAGIVITLLLPTFAFYLLLAMAGNISGAAGDLWMAVRLWRQPAHLLIEDTETGYRAWEVGPSEPASGK